MTTKAIEDVLDLLHNYENALWWDYRRILTDAKELQSFIANSPYRQTFNASILDLAGGVDEPTTSSIIRTFFSYKGVNNDYPVLKSFIDRFLTSKPKILQPIIEAETSHFDISILDKDFAIIVENKLKNAPFQRNQLARYIKKLLQHYHYSEENIYIVILPKEYPIHIRKSTGRLPQDWKKNNADRHCAVDKFECWCDFLDKNFNEDQIKWCERCDKTILKRLKNNTFILHDDFAEWLLTVSSEIPEIEWSLKSSIIQFADYIKGLYSTRLNNKLKMAVQEYLSKKILTAKTAQENFEIVNSTLEELSQLKAAIENLKVQLSIDIVKEWESMLKLEIPAIEAVIKTDFRNNVYSFGVLIEGIWVGCWSGTGTDNQNKPYWGFFCHKEPTERQIQVVRSILDEAGYSSKLINEAAGFLCWENTMHGVLRCKNFYTEAIDLGFLPLDN